MLGRARAEAAPFVAIPVFPSRAFRHSAAYVHTGTRALMGPDIDRDWWPYGVEPNRATLETFLRYASSQGLAERPLAVDELFATETRDTFRI